MSTQLPTPTPSASLTETKGDLFASPDSSVLVHACNCQGAWGKGIAKRFRQLYPAAYAIYRAHCLASLAGTERDVNGGEERNRALLGTALLIPPQPADLPRRHWIGCLFTRWHYRGKADVQGVMEATRGAVRDLVRVLRLEEMRGSEEGGLRIGEVCACRINAGCFGVEWGETRRVLGEEGVGWRVVELEGLGERKGPGPGPGRGGRERKGFRGEMEGERGKREEGLERGGRARQAVGREGDELCEEDNKASGEVEAGEDAALRRVDSVSGSTKALRDGRMHEGGKVDARRGKRRRLV